MNNSLMAAMVAAHLFNGWADPLPPAFTLYESTITVPAHAPAYNDEDTAWVMVLGGSDNIYNDEGFTQIGWFWYPYQESQPMVFVYSDPAGDVTEQGGYFTFGPLLKPGTTLTVRIARIGADTFLPQYRAANSWVALGGDWTVPGPVQGETDSETWGPTVHTCFSDRTYFDSPYWMTLPSGCVQ